MPLLAGAMEFQLVHDIDAILLDMEEGIVAVGAFVGDGQAVALGQSEAIAPADLDEVVVGVVLGDAWVWKKGVLEWE